MASISNQLDVLRRELACLKPDPVQPVADPSRASEPPGEWSSINVYKLLHLNPISETKIRQYPLHAFNGEKHNISTFNFKKTNELIRDDHLNDEDYKSLNKFI